MKAFATSRRPDAEKIGIVGHLHLTLLAGDVDAHRKTLTVGVESSQRCNLRFLQMLLEEEA